VKAVGERQMVRERGPRLIGDPHLLGGNLHAFGEPPARIADAKAM